MFLYYLRNILTKMGPKRLQKVPQQRNASRETFLTHEYYKKYIRTKFYKIKRNNSQEVE